MLSEQGPVIRASLVLDLSRAPVHKASGRIGERCAQHIDTSISMVLVFRVMWTIGQVMPGKRGSR